MWCRYCGDVEFRVCGRLVEILVSIANTQQHMDTEIVILDASTK